MVVESVDLSTQASEKQRERLRCFTLLLRAELTLHSSPAAPTSRAGLSRRGLYAIQVLMGPTLRSLERRVLARVVLHEL